jgi:hypothetical protein
MIRLLKGLLRPTEPFSDLVHFHIDDDGREFLCDSSACRPSRRAPYSFPPLYH